jgi:hypothetical protein
MYVPPLRDFNRIPFLRSGGLHNIALFSRLSTADQDRLTLVQILFTRNLSSLQSTSFSFVYLLLPPRSALKEVPPRLTPGLLNNGKVLKPFHHLHAFLLFRDSHFP